MDRCGKIPLDEGTLTWKGMGDMSAWHIRVWRRESMQGSGCG